MSDYFTYRWCNYKHHCFMGEGEDKFDLLTEQVPEETIDKLKITMVFRPFLDKYSHVLNYEKLPPWPTHARYTWGDEGYREYLREIMKIMEPRCETEDVTIINEMDEFLEVTFFTNGAYKVGYSMNNKRVDVQSFSCKFKGNVIGAYGVTFNKRAVIIYTTITRCYGHFIRKTNW